ncbi:hypothetical protein R50912_02140 [Paenibacillus sp. FSL R5-0912]|nr:hypothetical protein R50912_02140 [Paenibacillus sp. FSL R5-0912]
MSADNRLSADNQRTAGALMPAVLCVAAESGTREEMRGISALDSAENVPKEEMRGISALDYRKCSKGGNEGH